jgi:hypothetical protein
MMTSSRTRLSRSFADMLRCSFSGSSSTWRTVMRGLSEALGSWKTICMWR